MTTKLQQSVFPWIVGEEGSLKRHATISIEEIALRHGVPADYLVEFLQDEIKSADSCRSLPVTLLLVVTYAVMIIAHFEAPLTNSVEDSMAHVLHLKTLYDWVENKGHDDIEEVTNFGDFWEWLTTGFIPVVFVQGDKFSETTNMSSPEVQAAEMTYPREQRGTFLAYNRIVLGVRMSQQRYDEISPCANAALAEVYGKECVGGFGWELEPEKFFARKTSNPTRVRWLYIHDDMDEVLKDAARMEAEGWLDERTMKVEVAFPIYNAEYGIHSLMMCNFWISRGGKFWKDIIPLSIFASWTSNWYNIMYDFIWLSCLMWIFATELYQIIVVCKHHGVKGMYNHYINVWTIVDWVAIVSGMGIIMLYAVNVGLTTKVNTELDALSKISETTDQAQYREQGLAYVEALEGAVHFLYYFTMVLALYPLVLVLMLFKAFDAQPRLAVLTNTLLRALPDLAHFMVIFCSVFIIYAVAGVVLFGRETDSFTTIFRSCGACFRMMHGDFDWDEMKLVGRFDAAMWFVPFTVMLVMILLNMLVAIVMDAYYEVKGKAESTDTLLRQGLKVWDRFRAKRRGELVDIPQIVKALVAAAEEAAAPVVHTVDDVFDMLEMDSLDGGEDASKKESVPDEAAAQLYTVRKLRQLFPAKTMRATQAKEIIKSAVLRYYSANRESSSLDEAMHLIRVIDHRTRSLKRSQRATGQQVGQAADHVTEVESLISECHDEVRAAQEDLYPWLPEDPDDIPLQSINNGGSSRSKTGKDKEDNAEEGSTTVSDKSGGYISMERRLQELEQELGVGRETVAESLQAVNELTQRLHRSRDDRRRAVEKYNTLRQRAVALTRENRSQREIFQQGQVKLKVLTEDRDAAFEQVRAMVDENKDLMAKLAAEENRAQRRLAQPRER